MHWSALPRTDQIFTHLDEDTGLETIFAASALRRYCDAWPGQVLRLTIPLNEDFTVLIMKRRGIERPRLRRAQRTRTFLPLLHTHMPDGTSLLIDGSHTYVAMWMQGLRTAKTYLIPEHIWRNFLVEGIPPAASESDLLNSYSGIKT